MIRADIDDRALRRRLRQLSDGADDLEPMWRAFDRDVGNFFRRRFETAGRHGGSPWKPLARSTRKARQRADADQNVGGVGKPLWASGTLKKSLEEVGGRSIRHIGRRSYVRGTRVPYAVHHQEGHGVPQREIVPEGASRDLPRVLWFRLLRRIREHMEL